MTKQGYFLIPVFCSIATRTPSPQAFKYRVEVPKYRVEVPKYRVEVPKYRVEVPKYRVEVPKYRVEVLALLL